MDRWSLFSLFFSVSWGWTWLHLPKEALIYQKDSPQTSRGEVQRGHKSEDKRTTVFLVRKCALQLKWKCQVVPIEPQGKYKLTFPLWNRKFYVRCYKNELPFLFLSLYNKLHFYSIWLSMPILNRTGQFLLFKSLFVEIPKNQQRFCVCQVVSNNTFYSLDKNKLDDYSVVLYLLSGNQLLC